MFIEEASANAADLLETGRPKQMSFVDLQVYLTGPDPA